jgi:dTMP kinase
MFISFDGIDGTGKTTQIALLVKWLAARGNEVVQCVDPGSTPLGEAVRAILLDRHDLAIDRTSEMFLFMAARAQLVAEVIRPALAAGKTVVSDRFLLANVVYQGHAGGLDPALLWQIGEVATGGLTPDVTLLLDLPVAAADARINRQRDRMENRGVEYRERLRAGFLLEAQRRQEIAVIDAGQSVEAVHAAIVTAISARAL